MVCVLGGAGLVLQEHLRHNHDNFRKQDREGVLCFCNHGKLTVIAVPARGSPLLGVAALADRLGQAASPASGVQFFASLGIPAPWLNAHFVTALELGGGILFALGLAGRLVALPLTIDMIMAYLTADRQALLSTFSTQGSFTMPTLLRF